MHHTTATGGVADIAIQNAWIGSSLSYNNYGEALLAGIVWRWIEEKKKILEDCCMNDRTYFAHI